MAASRTVVIVGAGIGGLTTALTIANRGFRVALLEQSERLVETGAGLQLSPNATCVLLRLGLGDRLKQSIVAPLFIRIGHARTGSQIAKIPLGTFAAERYGAPYWSIHRADLQAVLLEAVQDHPDIALTLGAHVADCAVHANGVTVGALRGGRNLDTQGLALIGADGVWSSIRVRLGDREPPRFASRTAWRALVPVNRVAAEWRGPAVNLWLGPKAHLVHYPVRGGAFINVVAISEDDWREQSWSGPAEPDDVLRRFPEGLWCRETQAVLRAPKSWLKWPLADRAPGAPWGRGPVTLVGDAAHPMLPFLAQGAGMAIEDAAVLASQIERWPGDIEKAMRAYEAARQARVRRVQLGARSNDRIYHLDGPAAVARNIGMLAMGGRRLLSRYDWLYGFLAESRPATGKTALTG